MLLPLRRSVQPVAHGKDIDVYGFTGRRVFKTQPARNSATPVSTLRQITFVPQYVSHEFAKQAGHFAWPKRAWWLAGETKAR